MFPTWKLPSTSPRLSRTAWVVMGCVLIVALFLNYASKDGQVRGILPFIVLLVFAVTYATARAPIRVMIDAFEATGNRTCPRCMYDLRGLDDAGECPGCGEPYSPELLEWARERLGRHFEKAYPESLTPERESRDA